MAERWDDERDRERERREGRGFRRLLTDPEWDRRHGYIRDRDYERDRPRDERWGAPEHFGRDRGSWRTENEYRDADSGFIDRRGFDTRSEYDVRDEWDERIRRDPEYGNRSRVRSEAYGHEGYGGGMASGYSRPVWSAGHGGATTQGTASGAPSWFRGDSQTRRDSSGEYKGRFGGRGPRDWQRSDKRLHEDVCDRLTEHPDVDASDIEVKVSNCEVTLSGTVDDRHQKRVAEDAAWDINGVREVHNHLRVLLRDERSS